MDAITSRFKPSDAPPVGEYWKGQGGIYAGIMPDYVGTEPRFLVFAADDAVDLSWGGFGSPEPGARDPYNGVGNTRSLVRCARRPHLHDAAHFAAEYEKDGHRDFYLPSKRELDVAYETIPDSFAPAEWYWSSTEESKIMAYGRTFDGPGMPSFFKHEEGRVRPVRSFPVASDEPAA
jgi:hypothetical protein